MQYFTESQLRGYAQPAFKSSTRGTVAFSERQADLSVFLSHSHKDGKLAEGFAAFLASLGITVYIDWQDTAMPASTNRVTAERIKQRIKTDDVFILLATNDALLSRWCPWELGVADQMKTEERILIVPVKPDGGLQYVGNEYCQLYRTVEKPDLAAAFRVFAPGEDTRQFAEQGYVGTPIQDYLKRFVHLPRGFGYHTR